MAELQILITYSKKEIESLNDSFHKQPIPKQLSQSHVNIL